MNEIYLGGKISSEVTEGNYPDGTPLATFHLKESFKGNKNSFKVIVTGEDNIRYLQKTEDGLHGLCERICPFPEIIR